MTKIKQLLERFQFLMPIEDDEVAAYVSSIIPSAFTSYENKQYQLSYFDVHLVFMTYLYCAIWQISKLSESRFLDISVFARPYNGREKQLKFHDIKSVFELSNMPEADVANFLLLIDVDKGFVGQVKKLVDYRNNMAHANGTIQISTESEYCDAIREIDAIINIIEKKMQVYIKAYYGEVLEEFWMNHKIFDFDSWDDLPPKNCTNFKVSKDDKITKRSGTKQWQGRITQLNRLS